MDGERESAPQFAPLRHYRITQQKLPSWRPLLTRRASIILLEVCGGLLIVLGLVFFFVSRGQFETRVRYDNIRPIGTSFPVTLDVPREVSGRVELRYELLGFYQNHRRFSFSRVDAQLMGQFVDFAGMANAAPYRSVNDTEPMENWFLPCGLFPLSVFNDSFHISIPNTNFVEEGLAFNGERETMFQPLNVEYTSGIRWLNDTGLFPGEVQNEHFITWMRTSFLSRVVKTYAICEKCKIGAGRYNVEIDNRYPTEPFGGEKYLALTLVGGLGSKNQFLGIAYLTSGAVCAVYGIFLLIVMLVCPRELGQPRS